MAEFLYEYLVRGRAPGDSQPPAFQIVLADVDRPYIQRVLNVEEALAEGFDPASIGAKVDAAAQADCIKKQADYDRLFSKYSEQGELLKATQIALREAQEQLASIPVQE